MSLPSIIALTPEEIIEHCALEKSFQGFQIFQWISKGITSFDEMTNISNTTKERLKSKFSIYTTRVESKLKDGSSVKLALEMQDGAIVEAVLLKDGKGRTTACLSSQVGCPLSCAFCKTGKLGYSRNLTAGEIIEEFHHLNHLLQVSNEQNTNKLDRSKKTVEIENIVFMGMGEPLLNTKNVKKAIFILTHPKGIAMSRRRITLSTAGVVSEIYSLADDEMPPRLAVSLTTADPVLRLSLMPIEKTNPLNELKNAIQYFNEKTKKRVTLEVALIANVNTSKSCVEKIVNFADGLNVLINLIPWNPIEDLPFSRPSETEIAMVESTLKKAGLNVTVRTRKAGNISGSCGQLGRVKNV